MGNGHGQVKLVPMPSPKYGAKRQKRLAQARANELGMDGGEAQSTWKNTWKYPENDGRSARRESA